MIPVTRRRSSHADKQLCLSRRADCCRVREYLTILHCCHTVRHTCTAGQLMTRVVAMGLNIVRARLSDSLVTYYACEIVGGRIGAGEPLPSEPSIAAQFGV